HRRMGPRSAPSRAGVRGRGRRRAALRAGPCAGRLLLRRLRPAASTRRPGRPVRSLPVIRGRRWLARFPSACSADYTSSPGQQQQSRGWKQMSTQPVVPVSHLLDERGLGSFQIVLIVWSFFIVLIDGYDIAAIAFAAPHLVQAWGIQPRALGPVFSASLVGIL